MDRERPVILADCLSKRFGDFVAVRDVSFAVPEGEVFGFLGPNGAGKTTVIRVLLGLLTPTSGRAQVLGFDLPDQAKAMHGRVGYMSQLFTLYDDLTAYENVSFYGRVFGLRGSAQRRRVAEILEMAGLRGRENELTSGLSGGWRQRLALGCAIVHQPELVFLDEPTAGVDPVSRREFWNLIYALADRGTTVFVTTHYMDEAEHCQRLGFISQGVLVALGSPDELKLSRMRGAVFAVGCSDPERAVSVLRRAMAEGALVWEHIAQYGATVHLVLPDDRQVVGVLEQVLRGAGIAVHSVERIAPSLEDVFVCCVAARGEQGASK